MPHQQPSVDDYDSDESRAPKVYPADSDSVDVAGKRTPRPYGAGVDAAKPRRGSDSGYSSRTTTTHNSTNSTQYSQDSRADRRPGSRAGTNLTESTLKPSTLQATQQQLDRRSARSISPSSVRMSKKNRPRQDEGICTNPDCHECQPPPMREYSRNPPSHHHRSQSYSRYPPSPNQATYPTAAYAQQAYPPTIPRPRASTSSKPRPMSYYGGMPTEGYFVPVGPSPAYSSPMPPDPYYPANLPPGPYHSYAVNSAMPSNMTYLPRSTTMSAPVPQPHYETARPKLRPIRTDNYVMRSRPFSTYGTPVVSYDQAPYERASVTQSAGPAAPQDFALFDYEDDRRRMPPPSRHSRYSPDEPSPNRQVITRQSRTSVPGRSTGDDQRLEDYDDFDSTAKLPSSRNPSQRRPSLNAKSPSYSPYSDTANTVDRVIESRSGRRALYSAEDARTKTERAMGESERYQAEVAGRSSIPSSSRPRESLDQGTLQKSMSRKDSDSRRDSLSQSRSRTGSTHDGREGGPVKINVDKDGGYSISVNDGHSVRMRVVPQEDGAKEIIIGGSRNDAHYRTGSMRSVASSRTGRSIGPRDDGRKDSRSSRRRSNDEP